MGAFHHLGLPTSRVPSPWALLAGAVQSLCYLPKNMGWNSLLSLLVLCSCAEWSSSVSTNALLSLQKATSLYLGHSQRIRAN